MANFTLRQLRYFEALAAEGHFGRAAERCAISQPALSVQIRDLEATLGVHLFERGPRGVTLTSLGEDCAQRIKPILRGLEELGDWALASQGGTLGRLRLGVIPTIAPYILPQVVAAMTAAHPAMDLHVRETITPRLTEELLDGQLDAAIVALPLDVAGLAAAPLLTEDMVLVRPAAQAHSRPLAQEDLARQRLLLLEEGHCFRDQALSFCNLSARQPREGLDGSTLSTLVQMVGAGLGVTLIPEMAIRVETQSAPVCVQAFAAPAPTRTIGLVWRASTPMAPALHSLAPLITEAVGV